MKMWGTEGISSEKLYTQIDNVKEIFQSLTCIFQFKVSKKFKTIYTGIPQLVKAKFLLVHTNGIGDPFIPPGRWHRIFKNEIWKKCKKKK